MSGYRPVEVPGFGDACGIDDPGVPHVEVLHVASFVRAGRQAQVEQAFALLGEGRYLLGLARPTGAAPVLQHAREIFEWLQAAPPLPEIDALLASTS
ncbi:MAG: hypothetical protein M3516_02485 [Actinomycetota bacterium]|nr:hypothetical protein [Actinomycetota bacterium]